MKRESALRKVRSGSVRRKSRLIGRRERAFLSASNAESARPVRARTHRPISRNFLKRPTGFSAEQSEFVLDRDDVNVTEIQIIGSGDVIIFYICAYFKLNRIAVDGVTAGAHSNHEGFKLSF